MRALKWPSVVGWALSNMSCLVLTDTFEHWYIRCIVTDVMSVFWFDCNVTKRMAATHFLCFASDQANEVMNWFF